MSTEQKMWCIINLSTESNLFGVANSFPSLNENNDRKQINKWTNEQARKQANKQTKEQK